MFLVDELPIRLAHRVVELENLPHGLSQMPSVIKVRILALSAICYRIHILILKYW
jgi:hypothetical protein